MPFFHWEELNQSTRSTALSILPLTKENSRENQPQILQGRDSGALEFAVADERDENIR